MTASDRLPPSRPGDRGYYVDQVMAHLPPRDSVGDYAVVVAQWGVAGYLVGWMLTIWPVILLFNHGSIATWDGNSWWPILGVAGGVWPAGAILWAVQNAIREARRAAAEVRVEVGGTALHGRNGTDPMSDPRQMLDTYANEDGAIARDDGIRREQCARRAFAALRAVLDHMDLAVELMPNVPAVPVSVLRSVITRALEGR